MKRRILVWTLLLTLAVLPAAARADVVIPGQKPPEPAEVTAAFAELYGGDFVEFDPTYTHALDGPVETALWLYPGAAEPLASLTLEGCQADQLSPCYVDDAGRFWGYTSYLYGYRFVWICLSDPTGTGVEPDQAVISQVEARAAELEAAERTQVVLAVVLVTAVVAVTLLLILRFRRQNRGKH
ncbi:hypothetical protein [Intestinimonas butyriciproducens]|uniref:hypothetical protein n=1 Tax=Intestinimonas butyriciproducens TaxID=1297617 RepID=UPI00195CFAB6|nr:hypothetical protein [Intestinimonas butyriciproducens]MBM6977803.1 hypothetical protein [Intestinimonas butyriciproducens]